MSDKEIITNLQQRSRELKVTAGMMVEEATNIEKELERINAPQVSAPGRSTGSTLTDAEIAKARAPMSKKLAEALANS